MACGGGELVVDLARYAAKLGLPVSVHGCDINPKSVLFASRKALASGLPVKFFTCDIVNDSIPCGYDVFTSSLFLHHLSEDDALHLLGAIRSASPGLLVVSDLIRCTGGFILAQIACRILTRSYIVHYDGPRSVASAYTIREIDELADRAGLSGHRVDWTWPYRYVLTWKPE
jgi:2-polyprenyl-3-methyl-5-hydroxy-6-metoxy-1,4-benzoquinol methylase